jgi:two-component system CheB/CheR fusion protein
VSEPAADDPKFEALLEFLRQSRGFDFTGYKRPSLMRRVGRRIQALQLEGFDGYRDYLEANVDEFALLFNTILINVTSFFRDPPAWEVLRREVIPRILETKGEQGLVRAWSAGCATGEEAYSLAISLAEAMGADAFRERVKIYATDVDEDALNHARQAIYTARDLEAVDEALRERYFERVGLRWGFRGDLRRAVIFGRNDLMQDAPISRLDLLCCRNTLMYFNAETQARIMSRFHFALGNNGNDGYLFLGRAEMLLTQSPLFAPIDLKCRIFVRVPQPGRRAPAAAAPGNGNGGIMDPSQRLREQALEESPLARVIADANGTLVSANQRARVLFSLNPKDVGRPLKDLEISYRPADLRSLVEQAYAERRAVTQTSVERRFASGESQVLDIVAQPIFDDGQAPLGVSITFVDMTRYAKMQDELRETREQVQTANEELQSSNEELETTNEELQSSNEELETTNEELQSTNEELETMNEELQSTNEELQAVNEELRRRTEELNHSNSFLSSVLGSLRVAAVVVNKNLDVLSWNKRAEDLWGLRAEEVQGKSLLNLDIGLPVAELRGVIRPVLNGEAEFQEVRLEAVNRRGKSIKCRVAVSQFLNPTRKLEGVILQMEDVT